MRQNGRLSGINSIILTAAGILLLQAFGSSVVKAQGKPASDEVDRELFKSPVSPRLQDPASSSSQRVGQQPTKGGTALPGSGIQGITTDVIPKGQGGTLVANAGPSNCVLNPGPQPASGLTCNLFETDAGGNPSEISNVIILPAPVGGGYLVLKVVVLLGKG